jgi:hypothetical protein
LGQSEQTLAFLAAYGWAMWAVQQFEYNLAALTILRAPVKSPGRQLDSEQKMYSALQKQFATYRHRFERASARELQNLLPDELPARLRSDLDDLIDARNDLAHRYLRRTLEPASPNLRHELQAVQALGQRFVAAGDELLALMEQSVADRPANLTDAQYEALQRLGRAAAAGASLDDALTSSTVPDGS